MHQELGGGGGGRAGGGGGGGGQDGNAQNLSLVSTIMASIN